MTVINGKIKKIFYRGRGGFAIGLFSVDDGDIIGKTITVKGVLPGIRDGIKCKLDGDFVVDEKYGKQFNVRRMLFDQEEIDEEGLYRMIFVLLTEAAKNGNTFLFYEEVLNELRMRYGISQELLDDTISMENSDKYGIVIDSAEGCGTRFYIDEIFNWEVGACENLRRLNQTAENFKAGEVEIDFEKIESRMGISLSTEQMEAVSGAVFNGVTVITGGPGTGKTTILRAVTMLLREIGYIVALAAPTGRAAKRIKESTGYRGYTIHRLLEASIDEKKDEVIFRRNEENPLEVDAVIVDEASMIDVELMSRLLEACMDGTKLVLVGDVDQLPPVGPGSVLRDIIESEYIHTTLLKSIFRQAEESKIVVSAHEINRGEEPDLTYTEGDDLIFLPKSTYAEVREEIAKLAAYEEAQVITPTKRGQLGTASLNKMLQNKLNPREEWKQEIRRFSVEDNDASEEEPINTGASPKGRKISKKNDIGIAVTGDTETADASTGGISTGNTSTGDTSDDEFFRLGDRVMQIKNNYGKQWKIEAVDIEGLGLFNGDMGKIIEIDPLNEIISVEFDEGKVAKYERKDFKELQLSYAITVHKSQGSEFQMVVMPVANFGPVLGTKNLLYTGITRGKDNVILLGDERALIRMIHCNTSRERNSGIKDRLSSFL